MKKIMAVCGSGLGSSFMVDMNIAAILKDIGKDNEYETGHTSLAECTQNDADIFVTALDLADSAQHLSPLVILNRIMDKTELKTKLLEIIGG